MIVEIIDWGCIVLVLGLDIIDDVVVVVMFGVVFKY